MEPIRPLPEPETRRRRTGRNNRNRRTIPRKPRRQQHRRTPITRNPPLRGSHRTRRRRHHTRIHQPRQRTHHAASIRTPARPAAPRRDRRRQIRAGMAAHLWPRHHRQRGRTTPKRRPHPPHPKPTHKPHINTRSARGTRPTHPPRAHQYPPRTHKAPSTPPPHEDAHKHPPRRALTDKRRAARGTTNQPHSTGKTPQPARPHV